jgi:hypothetical protein
MMEEWKNVIGYEDLYQVSNLGRVKSLQYSNKILKNSISSRGYCMVGLYKNKQRKLFSVHKLVAIHFLDSSLKEGQDRVVDHIDNNPLNNHISNLQITSNRHNSSKDRIGVSKHPGVSFDKSRNKWISQIQINGKRKYLGRFLNETDAYAAYQKALN